MKSSYLVCYDVRDDRRLRQVARTLKSFGTRLQYSVFRCDLSERDIERLRWEVSRIMEPEDSLLVVGLCGACVKRIKARDSSRNWPQEPSPWAII